MTYTRKQLIIAIIITFIIGVAFASIIGGLHRKEFNNNFRNGNRGPGMMRTFKDQQGFREENMMRRTDGYGNPVVRPDVQVGASTTVTVPVNTN